MTKLIAFEYIFIQWFKNAMRVLLEPPFLPVQWTCKKKAKFSYRLSDPGRTDPLTALKQLKKGIQYCCGNFANSFQLLMIYREVHIFLEFCPDPPDVTNTVLLTEVSRIINSTLIYGCKEGFTRVSGSNYLSCVDVDDEGVWTGDILKCEKAISSGIPNTIKHKYLKLL